MQLLAPWPGAPGVVYGFTGRAGGVSRGPFASLNLSFAVGDEAACVRRNHEVLAGELPAGARLAAMRQVHGADVRIATPEMCDLGDGDAALTATAGVAVAVLTADCVPILLCAGGGAVVAAIHAGWRGTAADVAGAAVRTIAARFALPPASVEARLGPAIGPCCYEVGDEVVAALRAVAGGAAASAVTSGRSGRAHVDLRAANRSLLRAAGVPAAAIVDEGPCTRCAAAFWFSHRASGGRTGRQAAIVVRG